MRTQVEEIHLVCRRATNVSEVTATHFVSGWWVVAERHIRPGVLFALHEKKEDDSYLQGEVETLLAAEDGSDGNRRVQVRVRRLDGPMQWKGGGSGTSGYLWSGVDVSGLPTVPAVLPYHLGGGNKPLKSLFEAEGFEWPKGIALNARIGQSQTENNRLVELKGVLARLAAALGDAPVPLAFIDEAGLPWRLDDGILARAVALGWLEQAETHGEVRQLLLTDGFRSRQAGLIAHWRDATPRQQAASGNGHDPTAPVLSAPPPDPYEGFDSEAMPAEAFREAVSRSRAIRDGQAAFRNALLQAYRGRCAVTGTPIRAALEAAHIIPHELVGSRGTNLRNGILLRADVHALFDSQLIGFRPEADCRILVEVSPSIADTGYGKMHGRELRLPNEANEAPSPAALRIRQNRFPVI